MGRRVMVIYSGPTDLYSISHTKSLDIAGTEDIVNLTNNTWGIANAWTVSLWFKDTDTDGLWGALGCIFNLRSNANTQNEILLTIQGGLANDPVRMLIRDSAASIIKQYDWNDMANGTGWMHLAFTWDGTNLKGYRGGSEVAPTTKATDNSGTMTDSTRRVGVTNTIGGASELPCTIHSIAMWSTALSASDVSKLYNGGSGYNYNVRNANDTDLVNWTLFGYGAGDNFHLEVGSIDLGLNATGIDDTDQVTDYPGI